MTTTIDIGARRSRFAARTAGTERRCGRARSVTRSLLGYGVLAGPLYVTVSLAQALTRAGFDPTRHAWSLLSNGRLGWIQITNFVVSGLMVVAGAAGLRRALASGPGAVWAPRLIAVYGSCLVAAGVLRADPAQGFPAGTPAGPGPVSWHGIGHLAAGAIGFGCLIAACFVLGRRYATQGRRGWALASRVTGVGFLAAFIGIASGSAAPAIVLAFAGAVIAASTWLGAVCLDAYRRLAQ